MSGKLWAEGTDIEADLVTMSTFYLDGVQENEPIFKELALEVQPIDDLPSYQAPMTTQEGVIFYNTQAMEEADLPVPTSLADLADPIYEGQLAISDINHSSTAWLLFQGLIDQYGETKAQAILADIYDNAGDHIEASGSGPLKKSASVKWRWVLDYVIKQSKIKKKDCRSILWNQVKEHML